MPLLRGDDLLKYSIKQSVNLNILTKSDNRKRKAIEKPQIVVKRKKTSDGEKEKRHCNFAIFI